MIATQNGTMPIAMLSQENFAWPMMISPGVAVSSR